MKKFLMQLLVTVILSPTTGFAAEPAHFNILYSNDVRGEMEPCG